MEYTISQSELVRRKIAYSTLSISLMAGLLFASILLKFPVPVGGYLIVLTVILLLGLYSFKFLHTLSQTKIYLSNQILERKVHGSSEKYLIGEISHVQIKWTTHDTIREIYIWLQNDKSIFISALNHFEEFKNDLVDKLDTHVIVKETREPLDFDHPIFYAVLGLPISTAGVFMYTLILTWNYQRIKIVILAFFVYLLLLGIYFIAAKPISNRYGNKTIVTDYITGVTMISFGILLIFIFFSRT